MVASKIAPEGFVRDTVELTPDKMNSGAISRAWLSVEVSYEANVLSFADNDNPVCRVGNNSSA